MKHLTARITLLLASIALSQGADVTWDPVQTIAGDSDVVTTGTLERAYNFNPPSANLTTTVNGVTFVAFNVSNGTSSAVTVGDTTVSPSNGFFSDSADGSTQPPFSNLSASYQDFLRTDIKTKGGGEVMTLTLDGLTAGYTYLFQAWSNESDASPRFTTVTGGANEKNLDSNVGNFDGGVGQYAVGNFVADSTSQTITFSGGAISVVNGFQLRVVAIPESSAYAPLAAIGALALTLLVRRFKRSQ